MHFGCSCKPEYSPLICSCKRTCRSFRRGSWRITGNCGTRWSPLLTRFRPHHTHRSLCWMRLVPPTQPDGRDWFSDTPNGQHPRRDCFLDTPMVIFWDVVDHGELRNQMVTIADEVPSPTPLFFTHRFRNANPGKRRGLVCASDPPS